MFTPGGFGNVLRLGDGAPAIGDGYIHFVGPLVDAEDLTGAQQACPAVEPIQRREVEGTVLFILCTMKSLRQ